MHLYGAPFVPKFKNEESQQKFSITYIFTLMYTKYMFSFIYQRIYLFIDASIYISARLFTFTHKLTKFLHVFGSILLFFQISAGSITHPDGLVLNHTPFVAKDSFLFSPLFSFIYKLTMIFYISTQRFVKRRCYL